jgi:hypothetical protein
VSAHWTVVTRHLFRRTALARKGEIESLQLRAQAPGALEEIAELVNIGVTPQEQLRVAPARWHGFWRVEALRP